MRFTIPKEATDAEVVALIRQAAAVQKIRKHAAPIHPGTGTDQSVHAGEGQSESGESEKTIHHDRLVNIRYLTLGGKITTTTLTDVKESEKGIFGYSLTRSRWKTRGTPTFLPRERVIGGRGITYHNRNIEKSSPAVRIAKAGFAPTVTVDHTDTDQNLVFGWANISFTKDGTQVSDLQGHTIDIDDLEAAAYDFAVNFRKSGGMHKTGPWGDMVESFVATPEKMKALGIPDGTLPQGWWVGFRIPPTEFAKVKSGKWKMFSIQGKAQLEPYGP